MVSISSSFKPERRAARWPLTLVLDVLEKFHQLMWPGISNVTDIPIWSLLFSSLTQSYIKDQESLGPQWPLKLLPTLSGTAGKVCEEAWEQAGEDSSPFMIGISPLRAFSCFGVLACLCRQRPFLMNWGTTQFRANDMGSRGKRKKTRLLILQPKVESAAQKHVHPKHLGQATYEQSWLFLVL